MKGKFRAEDPQQEQAYWDFVVTIANEIVQESGLSARKNVPESDLDNILEVIRNKCYFDSSISNRLGSIAHPKSLIQRQEDLFLTTKSRVMKRLEVGEKTGFTLGIFVVSGKPVHDGHWKVIDIATKECDEVLVITSTAGRDELPAGVMIDAWRVVLEPQFHRDYPNATLLITSESPVSLAIDKMRELKNIVSSFIFYADDEDIRGKYSQDRISAAIKDPIVIEKFRPRAVPRAETTQISGTRMREFLKNDDRKSFDDFVPRSLSPEMKEKYWKILKNEYGRVQDSKIRPISKVLYEALKRQAPKGK
jgi:nicotinamide mononucleotide adenylyltransferase